jgi:hypothetical protein
LNQVKSKHAGLAQQNGFGRAIWKNAGPKPFAQFAEAGKWHSKA